MNNENGAVCTYVETAPEAEDITNTPPIESSSHSFKPFPFTRENCSYGVQEFQEVMLNLINNPNITSSHLFRADIFLDSDKDATFQPDAISSNGDLTGFVKHMKPEYRPWKIDLDGFQLERTIVRQLVPRNPQLDKSLIQTCHFFRSIPEDELLEGTTLVVYLPHVKTAEEMPWYHPPLRSVAFMYTQPTVHKQGAGEDAHGRLSIHACYFDSTQISPSSNRTIRTLQHLLETIHKHCASRLTGYKKRVHHDRIVSQKASQDTYTRLKTKYAKELITSWKEQTDVTKGVFEDLGIAAFLIELWSEMYDCSSAKASQGPAGRSTDRNPQERNSVKPPFPGFIDIGCGNGLLVYILIQEGYKGWGFDARSRKTWDEFPQEVRENLKEVILVPAVLHQDQNPKLRGDIHSGIFEAQSFIISNHADELTPWTPLLAYLNDSPFISIPCCSHDLGGAKWRFGQEYCNALEADDALPDNSSIRNDGAVSERSRERPLIREEANEDIQTEQKPGGQTKDSKSDILKPKQPPRPPSAYATLCGYVAHLSKTLEFLPEKEVLRIPSTRNVCILGRKRIANAAPANGSLDAEQMKLDKLRALVETEMKKTLAEVAASYVDRAMGVYNSKGRSH